MSRITKFLLAGAATLALAACGSSEVASPGEGGFGGGGGGNGGGDGGNGGGGGGAAPDCPTGFSNVGVINDLRNCQLPATITGNLVVPERDGTIYSLGGRTDVGTDRGPDPSAPRAGSAQGILTIEPGVTIFGSSGADFLVINRGSQIFAEGEDDNPVIFTSRQSVLGETGVDSIGQWGGIVILGRAPTNACPAGVTPPNIACEAQVEGTNAFYGGNTPADNSGRLRYVRVMHPGFEVLPGNELNGITLAGIGSGTTVEYVQVHNSSDDGIENFGGRVNLKHIVFTGIDDDSFDTDTGWQGTMQFLIAVQRENGGDRIFEMSCAGNPALCSFPQVSNATLVHRQAGGDNIILNSGTDFLLLNSVSTRMGTGGACLRIDGANTAAANPTFNSVYFSCPTPFSDSASSIGASATAAFFNAGQNNTANGTSTLTQMFINGANENAVTATNPTTFNSAFTAVDYIGAVRDAADDWWDGWTCGLTSDATC
ncbi:hypothetical protein [Brevundimonas sp.]|uniref:hypothetical protein n=1 Tax=Brevundimonas sp. TaxID=1871086 RepID=UPI0035B02D2D